VRVGRLFPSGASPAANDNRVPWRARARRAAYWLAAAGAAAWVLWSNL
jgi:hypothetical protein